MISMARSTSASPSWSLRGLVVSAWEYSAQTGDAHTKSKRPGGKAALVPAQNVAADGGCEFGQDVQGNHSLKRPAHLPVPAAVPPHWTKASAKTYVNMFEGPVTGNIPEVLDNGEVTDGTHVTAGQLALALTHKWQT